MAGVAVVKPHIHIEKCNTCGVCLRACPAEIQSEARKEKDSLRGGIYGYFRAREFNEDNSELIPCQKACPIHQDIVGYTRLIADRKYLEAMELIRESNALPSVTAYLCHHPCETKCVRSIIDESSSIRALKRFVVEYCGSKMVNPLKMKKNRGKKVSIIGAGPSGLAAAYDLIRNGYEVEIIEAASEPGGMLRWAIPSWRLPREMLNWDIQYIEKLGVVIKTGIRFGVDSTLSDIKKGGTDAVIIAIGTQKSIDIALLRSKDVRGYWDCLQFLGDYARGKQLYLGEKAIIVGGGNAAIDSARVARRCDAKEVVVVYRRNYEEMPADKDEVSEAEAEGIKFDYLTMPVRIIEKKGQVVGLQCIKTLLGEIDESGRRTVTAIGKSEFIIRGTSVISATGQRLDLSWNQEDLALSLSSNSTLATNKECLTNLKDVFAAGDCVNGPSTIVEAMGSGRRAAKSVTNYLSGGARGQWKPEIAI